MSFQNNFSYAKRVSSVMDWRTNIIQQLHQRNVTCSCFQDLINSHNRLFDQMNKLKTENIQLQFEKLKQEGREGVKPGDTGQESVIIALEQKLLAQQEELTEIHKKRGENAQLIVDLNNRLAEKDKLLAAKDEELSDCMRLVSNLRTDLKLYQNNNKQLENLNQVLKDEHQALQLAFTHLEEKLRKAQDENMELVERLKRYKFKDAEKLNEENENYMRKRNAKMQKELEDAAKDMRGLTSDDFNLKDCPVFPSTVIPTKPYIQFDSHDGEVNAVKWSPVDKLVATGGGDRKIRLWDISKGISELKGCLASSNAAIMSVDFNSNGTSIIAASNDCAFRVWTVTDLRLRHTLTGHCNKVLAAKFLSEPKAVTGSHDRTLKIWDLRSIACIETKFAGSSCNDLVTLDRAGNVIMSGHFDKKIRIWDTRSNAKPKEIELQGRVTSLDLSRDCKYLLSCVRDDTLRLIDLRMNEVSKTFSADGFKVGCDWSRAVFNSDASYVCVGSTDGSVFIWHTDTEIVEAILKNEHCSPVTAVSWHPFTNHLISVDRTKKAVIWSDV